MIVKEDLLTMEMFEQRPEGKRERPDDVWKKSTPVSSVHKLRHVRLFATPWTEAQQASLSITNSQNLLKLMSIVLVMPSNHLILCHPLVLLPSVFLNIRVFCNESVPCIIIREMQIKTTMRLSPHISQNGHHQNVYKQ